MPFDHPSFASMVFRKGRPLLLPDRTKLPRWVQVDLNSASRFKVGGSLLGVPMFSRGLRIGVLTAWRDCGSGTTPTNEGVLAADRAEMIIRTVQMLARTEYLRQISQFRDEHATTAEVCRELKKTIEALSLQDLGAGQPKLQELCKIVRRLVGVCRVRLFWAKSPALLSNEVNERMEFTCLSSVSGGRFNNRDRNSAILPECTLQSGHEQKVNASDNPFVAYVLRRCLWSSSAMLLYPDLLDSESAPRARKGTTRSHARDAAAADFERHPEVGWYVAPITRCTSVEVCDDEEDWSREHRMMLGFFAVDNTISPGQEAEENELPASRTSHELIRLKLSWCAAFLGYSTGRLRADELSRTKVAGRNRHGTGNAASGG
jgi:hypothetical protein